MHLYQLILLNNRLNLIMICMYVGTHACIYTNTVYAVNTQSYKTHKCTYKMFIFAVQSKIYNAAHDIIIYHSIVNTHTCCTSNI